MTNLIRLCRCSLLYQPTKPLTHCLAPSKELKPSEGHRGQYFTVLNNASE
ncbi:hypothetical protein BMETH_2222_0 [methanotrophic bacterial endosymbiont of Bathymodiolus sp.]|nr:hypothetical protein BMETH_2222_0 [methanotrophic bacterial endosymbiont of Bathymodiolus sp.]